jgi:hypothetical protein
MNNKPFEEIYNNAIFEHIYEAAKQIFDPNKTIKSPQEAIQALMYIAQILQNLAYSISSEKLQDSLDVYLPGTRLQEANQYDINQLNKNLTLINQHLNDFLNNNPGSIVGGIDRIIEMVVNYVNMVNEENVEPISTTTLQSISVFRTVLGTFNHLINIIDDHNINIDVNYEAHDIIRF